MSTSPDQFTHHPTHSSLDPELAPKRVDVVTMYAKYNPSKTSAEEHRWLVDIAYSWDNKLINTNELSTHIHFTIGFSEVANSIKWYPRQALIRSHPDDSLGDRPRYSHTAW